MRSVGNLTDTHGGSMDLESQQCLPHCGVFVTGYLYKLTGVVKNSLC